MPSWPHTPVSTHQERKLRGTKSPPPAGGRRASKATSRCRDGARALQGHRKQRPKRENPFSFVWVTHPPALPARRVLHFELPVTGPGSGHLSAHATGAGRAGPSREPRPWVLKAGRTAVSLGPLLEAHAGPDWRPGLPGPASPPRGRAEHVRRDGRAQPPPPRASRRACGSPSTHGGKRHRITAASCGFNEPATPNCKKKKKRREKKKRQWGGRKCTTGFARDGPGAQTRPQHKHEAKPLPKKTLGLELSHPSQPEIRGQEPRKK